MSNSPRSWPDPREYKFLVPSAKTVLRITIVIVLFATCWLFLAYEQATLLIELAKIVIYGCGGIGANWLVAKWRQPKAPERRLHL